MIYNWLKFAQPLIYPSTCLLCGSRGHHDHDLCNGCLDELPRNLNPCPICALPLPVDAGRDTVCGSCLGKHPWFDHCHAPFLYNRPISNLIKRLKFHNGLTQARLLAGLLGDSLNTDTCRFPELIIPVPLHPSRLRERGFNQALELARPLSRRFGIPLNHRICKRPVAATPQAALTKRNRQKSVLGVFKIAGPFSASHVVLVDDVITTGATASALARLLKKNGAKRVDVWAVARTQ
ncbi:MAG: ComF family protein [Gammaproteobacteria bacterium]|nr:ComF family protein [Gammaproteobacteria bacterium]